MSELASRTGRVHRLRPQDAFLLFAGVFGFLFVFVTPPLQVPDEPHHWFRMYELSQGHLLDVRRTGPNAFVYGARIPTSITDCCAAFFPAQGYWWGHVKVSTIVAEFRRPLRADVTRFEEFPNTALYAPLPYLPGTLAMAAARVLSLPPVVLLYAGRLGTLGGYLALGWAAIRVTPVLKWPAAVILVSPMNLSLAGSVSADPLTTGLAFLASAWALRCCLTEGPLTGRTAVAGGALMVGLALCKSAYVPVAAMAFAVPVGRWVVGRWVVGRWDRRRTGWLAPVGIVAAAGMAVVLWSAVTHPQHVHEKGDDPSDQLAWVRAHPGTYAVVFCRTMTADAPQLAMEMVGYLGWRDTPLPGWFGVAFFAVVLYLAVGCGEPIRLGARPRLIAAGAIAASVMLIGLANYMVWTKIGVGLIDGLQGRYYLPLALLGCAVLRRGHGFTVRPAWVATFMGFVCLYTLLILLRRYYLPDYSITVG